MPQGWQLRTAVAVLLCATAAFAGCAPGDDTDLSIAHVHGLGVWEDTIYVATHTGLFVREDGEWSRRSEDRADHMGFTLLSEDLMFRSGHPDSGGNLGVQRSTDGGRTWQTVATVLDSPVDFHAMTASSGDTVTVYGWSGGLYRSAGDPEQWVAVDADGLPSQVGALTASGNGTVYASTSQGLYRSEDRGASWQPRGTPRVVFALAAADDARVLYASDESDVVRSPDGGATWEPSGAGLDAGIVVALASSPDGRVVVAADQDAGLFISRDGSGSWSRVDTP